MTTNWHDGYVADIEYIPGYYREQSPNHIETVCTSNGIESPVEEGKTFTYCELGCGLGETSLITAATSPKARVFAFDFNPAHIAGARKIAQKSGIDNVYFGESSFKELAEGKGPVDMPLFDYVTLHGVWSWINHENRSYIVKFLTRYLKPGGIVYMSYNALPGWSNIIPMRNLLFMLANDEIGSTDQRAMKAVRKIGDMIKDGARFLPPETIERISKNPSYLSHEYLNASWEPTFHSQVAAELEAAKLSYFGTANMLENYLEYAFTPQQQEHLKTASPESRETLKDYFLERSFRKDLFIRGKRSYSFLQAMERIENTIIQLNVPINKIEYAVRVPLGQADLNQDLYKPVIEALDKNGPMRIVDILQLKEVKTSNVMANELYAMLIGSNQAVRSIPKSQQADIESIKKINKALVEDSCERQRNQATLACAATGQGLYISYSEMLTYQALANGCKEDVKDLVNAAIKIMDKRSDQITVGEKILKTAEEKSDFFKPHIESVLKVSIPYWKKMGAY